MKIKEGKFIVYAGRKPKQSYENEVPEGDLRPLKLFLQLLFNKSFRYSFNATVKYALRHASCYRGEGASEVILFESEDCYHKLWK